MISKRTVVKDVTVTEAGTLEVRMEKQVVEDGVVISKEYHRTTVAPDTDAGDQMAVVNLHLKAMGCVKVEDHEIDRVKRFAQIAHTPEVVVAFGRLRDAHNAVTKAENTKGADVAGAMATAEARYRDLTDAVRRRPV